LSVIQTDHDDCRGIWIMGPKGIGKTHLARKGRWVKDGDTIYDKPQSKWWDLYQGENVVIMDDVDLAGG